MTEVEAKEAVEVTIAMTVTIEVEGEEEDAGGIITGTMIIVVVKGAFSNNKNRNKFQQDGVW